MFFANQTAALAQEFKVGDRVYNTVRKKYGKVVEGGINLVIGSSPNVLLDEEAHDPSKAEIVPPKFLKLISRPQSQGSVSQYGGAATQAQGSVPQYGRPAAPSSVPQYGGAATQTQGSVPYYGTTAPNNTPVSPPASYNQNFQRPPVQQPAIQSNTATASAQGSVPSGYYTCSKISSGAGLMIFGNLEIQGNTYRGLDTSGPFAPFTVGAGGNLGFSQGLKGMEDVRIISTTYAGHDEAGRPLILIHYQGTYAADRIDCIKER
jgi:hypothetical protein